MPFRTSSGALFGPHQRVAFAGSSAVLVTLARHFKLQRLAIRPDPTAATVMPDLREPESIGQLEEMAQRVEQSMGSSALGFIAQRFQRRVEQLIYQPVERPFYFLLGTCIDGTKFVE